jgi:RecA-family ATPase
MADKPKLPPAVRAKLEAFMGADREIVRVKLSTIEPKRLKWLWHPYLPLGKVVIVAGAPGHGKSQLTSYMAACASAGTFYPGDMPTPGRVLLMSAEDDLDDTVVPRLMAANAGGGDLAKIETVSVRRALPGGVTSTGMIRIPGDLISIIDWAREDPESARLVVFDPVVSFFDREHSTYNNQDVRDAIDPLAAIAAEFGLTIVLVLHLNKSESREMAGRIAESHGFQAIARTVLAFGPDPDEEAEDEDEESNGPASKLLAITKSNLASARGATTMRFTLEPTMVLDNAAEPVPTMRLVPRTGRRPVVERIGQDRAPRRVPMAGRVRG